MYRVKFSFFDGSRCFPRQYHRSTNCIIVRSVSRHWLSNTSYDDRCISSTAHSVVARDVETDNMTSSFTKFNYIIDKNNHIVGCKKHMDHKQNSYAKKNQYFRWLQPFLPHHYPLSVRSNYLAYAKAQAIASILGSVIGVLATQSLLIAVGAGSGAIPIAATLNWILKDGLGQLGGVIFASSVGHRLDADPKRWRFIASVSLDLAFCLEICTAAAPQYFLGLAALANIGKNVSWLASSASRASIHRSLMCRENLADITAKSGSQTTACSVIGTTLGIGISHLVGSAPTEVLPAFIVLASFHLFAIYQSLTAVHINTLNRNNLESLVIHFIKYCIKPTKHSARLPSPKTLSRIESFVFRQHSPLNETSLNLSARVDELVDSVQHFDELLLRYDSENYLLQFDDKNAQVNVCLLEHSTVSDIIDAILHANITRKSIGMCETDCILPCGTDVDNLLEFVRKHRQEFRRMLKESGWNVQHILVETTQRRIRIDPLYRAAVRQRSNIHCNT